MSSRGMAIGRVWQLQEAKNKLSEVVDEATKTGPQVISRRGSPAVVVVAFEDYARLAKPRTTLVEFLRESPLRGVKLDIERNRDVGRDIDL